jgi:hypothetical protein
MVRQDANRRRQLARLAWEFDHGGVSPDVEWYSEQIAPRLCELSLGEIAGALGVSTSSAASSDGDCACRLRGTGESWLN